jgi:beta-xylosidase
VPVSEGRFPKFDGVDGKFAKGQIGLRVRGGAASFRNLVVKPFLATALAASYTNPVQSACADPVVMYKDGVYHAFCTFTPDFPEMVNGIRHYTSKNLVQWKDEGFALKNEDSWGNSKFWAPDIVEKDGLFYMYYAADTRMCVATSKSLMEPFKQDVQAPIEPDTIRIDGHVYKDDDGQFYFYYVKFNKGNEIWGGKLNPDMKTVDVSSLKLMVQPDQPWERHQAPIAEGPVMLKHKGTYYLTYSGSHFENLNYAVGYATSDSPLGPWKKYENNPIMKSSTYAHGTAHHCFTQSPDGKETFIVYHRHHTLSETEPRRMAIDRVHFVEQAAGPDALEIWGPTSSPQPLPSGAVKE